MLKFQIRLTHGSGGPKARCHLAMGPIVRWSVEARQDCCRLEGLGVPQLISCICFFSTNQIQIWHESWGMRLVMKGSPHLFRFPLQLCSGNVMAVAGLVKCDQLLGPWFYQFPWLDPRPCVWTFKLSHCNRCCIAFVSAWSSENIKSYQIRSLHMALWIPP